MKRIFFILICLSLSGCATKNLFINAASSGDLIALKSLQSGGQNINVTEKDGTTALMHAIRSKKKEAAKYLIEAGADFKIKETYYGYDALIYAVDYGQYEIIDLLLERGADIESVDNEGYTPLVHAVQQVRDLSAVKQLIKKGANIKYNDGMSILELALIDKRMDIVSELLNAGAKVFEPIKGKARLFFIGDGIFLFSTADVIIGDIHKYVTNDIVNFLDVSPGSYVIKTNVGYGIKSEEATVDAKAGQTYYFKVMPADVHAVSRMGGFHRFEVRPMGEAIAIDKIKGLLKTAE